VVMLVGYAGPGWAWPMAGYKIINWVADATQRLFGRP